MNLLLLSLFILLIILIIKYFVDKPNSCRFKLIIISGFFFSLILIGLYYLYSTSFGASTPVNIKTENQTNETISIYSITFWDISWNKRGDYVNYVQFDTKLKPHEKSMDFWFENDGTTEFWIVAKNDQNEIVYLKEFSDKLNRYNLEINEQENIDPKKYQVAKQLTIESDQKLQREKYIILANYILIGLLILSLIKKPDFKRIRL